ncbi:MAG: wax ester/triacylglycerol synthase family O-acyltransferase [Candidatus Promineifilaceae bacterium]|nr:wax ester/triacylglycerol synthase family O-acyltransferase [Candidatus Promineifilaceae bacterium]
MSLQKEKMSNVDTAWWHMEEPTNLMMITAIMTVEGELDYPRLMKTVEQRLLKFDRFRQRVADSNSALGAVNWELDPYFDLDAHMRRIGLPSPGGKKELEALVSDLMSTPLDYNKPLWQYHIIEGYESGYVIVGRLHHCIADGIALMRVLLSMTDETPDPIEAEEEPNSRIRRSGPLRRVLRPAIGAARLTGKVTGTVASESYKTVRNPGRVVDAAKYSARFAGRLGKVTLRWPDPPTLFKGDLGVLKRAAWSDPISLADVKRIGKVTGGTVNDVMAAAVTGALRRYMDGHDVQTAGLNFRAYIPFNLRPLDEPIELGNKFGLVFLQLPIGTVDQIERLQIIKQRMDELKSSTEPEVAITLLSTAGMLPKDIESQVFKLFHAKATAVMTNVPGPQKTLYLAGGRLRHILGWVPQAGNVGLGISILSYDGKILVGINTDAGLVPDPEKIIDYFMVEYEEYLDLANAIGIED